MAAVSLYMRHEHTQRTRLGGDAALIVIDTAACIEHRGEERPSLKAEPRRERLAPRPRGLVGQVARLEVNEILDPMTSLEVIGQIRTALIDCGTNHAHPGGRTSKGLLDDASVVDAGIDHRPRKGGHGRQALNILPWAQPSSGTSRPGYVAFHGVGPKHLQRYLDEFSYRFDRRWREGELFGFVLRRVVGGHPLPYRRLVAEGTA